MTFTFTDMVGPIAIKFPELTTFELEEWLWVGNPNPKEERAIRKELETRAERRQAIGEFLNG